MRAKEVTVGISDVTYRAKRRPWGPTCDFSLTTRIDFEDGQVWGSTIPGFSVRRKQDGTYTLLPPLHKLAADRTYYCALITKDQVRFILDTLQKAGYLEKVGTNNRLEAIAELEPDLLSTLPSDVMYYT